MAGVQAMRQLLSLMASAAIGACLCFPGAASAEKILVLPSTGNATVVSLTGADTAKAAVTFRQEREDVVAACFDRDELHTRNDPAAREKLKADCAAKETAPTPTATRKADCARLTVFMEPGYQYEGGVFTLIKQRPENGYVRTTWKSARTKRIVSNCASCGTPEINDTFRVLCPKAYREKFGGLEPF